MIGLALFGAGRIGAVHAANIAASAKARLVSVHDVNAAAARQIAARHGARPAAGAAEVLADRSVDAVLIATSTDTHVELITQRGPASRYSARSRSTSTLPGWSSAGARSPILA